MGFKLSDKKWWGGEGRRNVNVKKKYISHAITESRKEL